MAKGEAAPVAVTAKFDPIERPELFREVEESMHWTMEYADGAVANCHASYAENLSYFRAEAARGWAEIEHFDYSGQKLTTSKGPRKFPAVNHQLVQLDGMAECLLTGRPSPVPGEMGRRDVAVIDAVFASARAGGARVEVKA
jgi:glucose-fructose oxidoreductase